MKKIRAFIAIPLSSNVQSYLGNLTHSWSEKVPKHCVRWVKPHLMHITLRFLGNIDVDSLMALAHGLDKIAAGNEAFALHLDRIGCFPNDKQPRVIWVGLGGQVNAANEVKQEIDQALVSLGWEEDGRPFRPHLTLGRVKDSRKFRGLQWAADVEPLAVPVKAIYLIESTLHQSGPIYTVRHKSKLTH